MKVTAAYTINVRLGSVETEVSFSWGREADQLIGKACLKVTAA